MVPAFFRTLAASLTLACALPAAAATETREASGFSAFALSAPIEVELALGERESVTLEGDEKFLARVEVAVERGVLHVRMKGREGITLEWNLGRQDTPRARVTAKRLDAISVSGSGDIRVPQLRGEAVAISVSGSGDIDVRGGKVAALTVSISGSGDIRTPRLEAERVTVSISGSGDAVVWARQSLTVKVAGSGDVKFYGDPAVQSRIAGSGEVRRLGGAPS